MKQVQRQQLQQRLSPQQLQLMRLLQLPVTDLEQAIKQEVEKNPLLEAQSREEEPLEPHPDDAGADGWSDGDDDDYDYRTRSEADPNAVRREWVVTDTASFGDRLAQQLATRPLTPRQRQMAAEVLGSLDDAGYLTRDLDLLANDMAFRQGIDATPVEVEEVLHVVQGLDPAGVGARDLRECLLLQLQRMPQHDLAVRNAREIVDRYFDDFANHRYDRIYADLGLDAQGLEEAASVIRRLNPKPGSSEADADSVATAIIPDIVLTRHDDELDFFVNDASLPQLSLNSYYIDMLDGLERQHGDRQTIQFLRSRQAEAQGFIDLLQQRHDTIVRVMRYIVAHQRRFLLSGDPDQLQPLRQREVAEATGLDISTVSRMANSKYLLTDFGTIPLKDCFSKGLSFDGGEEVSVEAVKQRLSEAIAAEDKRAPLSDDALADLLKRQGYPIARRTVAKYREQMGIGVARLRRVIALLLLVVLSRGVQAQVSYYDSIMNRRYSLAVEAERRAAVKPAADSRGTALGKAARRQAAPAPAAQPVGKAGTAKTPAAAPPRAEDAAALPAHMVPLWYSDFPQHRVNPLGRTVVSQLPDEITLRLMRDTADFCFPVKNPKTSNYGWRWKRGHHGVDIRLRTGDPVHAAFGGVVRVASRMGGYGNCIVVRHPNGLETLYGHLSKINVAPHQEVKAGDVIGLGGSTGNSTGPHLHFEVRFLYQTFDPEWILDFSTYTLRTRSLHLDKSYFGIRQPRKGEQPVYKADQSLIKEPRKKSRGKKAANKQEF